MAQFYWHDAVDKIRPYVVQIRTPRASGTGFFFFRKFAGLRRRRTLSTMRTIGKSRSDLTMKKAESPQLLAGPHAVPVRDDQAARAQPPQVAVAAQAQLDRGGQNRFSSHSLFHHRRR